MKFVILELCYSGHFWTNYEHDGFRQDDILTKFFTIKVAVVAVGMSERSEEHCDDLKVEMKLLKQDLHTAKKEFILACKISCQFFFCRCNRSQNLLIVLLSLDWVSE